MLVEKAMTKDPVVCTAETPLREVVALFRKHHIGGLPVIRQFLFSPCRKRRVYSIMSSHFVGLSISSGAQALRKEKDA